MGTIIHYGKVYSYRHSTTQKFLYPSYRKHLTMRFFCYLTLFGRIAWRNGSASDSRSEGCVFDSRRDQSTGAMVARLTPDQKVACSIHVAISHPKLTPDHEFIGRISHSAIVRL